MKETLFPLPTAKKTKDQMKNQLLANKYCTWLIHLVI